MLPNSAPCSTRSTSRSPLSSPTAPTTRTGFTVLWPGTPRKPRLFDQIDEPLAAVIADGAYDQDRVYDGVAEHSAEAVVVVPPRSTAVLSASAETNPTQRDRHIQVIAEQGRMAWQKTSGYNARAGVEGTMSRYKRIIGDILRSHSRPAQETRIAVTVLNRMLDLARSESVRAA